MKKITLILIICASLLMLASCSRGSAGTDGGASAYRVITVDESGAPVAGVSVQLCSEQLCLKGETDAEGIVIFDQEKGEYTVHVIGVPEGFADDASEYPVPETYGDVMITLKASD